jgi:septal ring factor EnvC (AmiA/AmiB activator)
MSSIYVQLALLALIFSCFGFLLHAFYFGNTRQRHLIRELKKLHEALDQKRRELVQSEEKTQKEEGVIQSLEKQLQQRSSEMEHLKQLASRQDKAIELLQREAEVIRAALSGSAKSVKPVQEVLKSVEEAAPASPPPPPRKVEPQPQAPVQIREQPRPHQEMPVAHPSPAQGDAPAWKENLDNILSMLDTMEKEVDR